MAKRPKKGKPAVPTTNAELTQNPFAALAGLSVAEAPSPPADARADAQTTTPEPATTEAGSRFSDKLVVRREKKGRGGKTITRISGLPAPERAALAKRMKKNLGCSASVEGEDVILHGSLVDRAAEWLESLGARRVVRAN